MLMPTEIKKFLVMLMGTVVSKKRYSAYEYMCASFISFGTAMFMIISSHVFIYFLFFSFQLNLTSILRHATKLLNTITN